MNYLHRHQPDLSWFSEFDRFFNPDRNSTSSPAHPEAVHESDDSWVLQIDVPGFTKEEVKLNVENQSLVLSAESTSGNAFARKIRRKWKLGSRIDAGAIRAELENGVLSVTLPKSEPQETREITIS